MKMNHEWVKKMWYIYTMEYYSALKKEGNFTLCDSVGGPAHNYAEWKKPLRESQASSEVPCKRDPMTQIQCPAKETHA